VGTKRMKQIRNPLKMAGPENESAYTDGRKRRKKVIVSEAL